MARKVLSAQAINQKWLAGMMGSASANYTAGIQNVHESPTAKAATDQATSNYLSGVQAAVSSGRRAAALNNVSLQQWQQASITKGAQRLASGAQASSAKQLAAMQRMQPVYQAASDAAAAIVGPKGKATAMAKISASLDVLMAAKGK